MKELMVLSTKQSARKLEIMVSSKETESAFV